MSAILGSLKAGIMSSICENKELIIVSDIRGLSNPHTMPAICGKFQDVYVNYRR